MSDDQHFDVETRIPTSHGTFRVRAYTDRVTEVTNLALISGEPRDGALVRVHSECITGEAFGSLKCECGPQLEAALEAIDREGGIVLYLRGHEGRGIGLVNKLRAYALQEQGLDTVDANTALGLPADARDYSAAAAILRDLGIGRVRLLTNNPAKQLALTGHGIEVSERIPLVVGRNSVNAAYLDTKAARMGHRYQSDAATLEGQHRGHGELPEQRTAGRRPPIASRLAIPVLVLRSRQKDRTPGWGRSLLGGVRRDAPGRFDLDANVNQN